MKKGLVAAAAAGALLAGSAGQASAVGAGTGTSRGFSSISEFGTPAVPLCLQAKANAGVLIKLYNTGTFDGGTNPNVVTVATLSGTPIFYFSPAGTFNNPLCAGAPYQVPGTLAVGGCTAVPGTYLRTGDQYVIRSSNPTGVPLSTSCPGGPAMLEFTGEQTPCVGPVDPCGPDGPTSTEFVGVYSQTPTG